jgi:hypothetical protein
MFVGAGKGKALFQLLGDEDPACYFEGRLHETCFSLCMFGFMRWVTRLAALAAFQDILTGPGEFRRADLQ